ncbi:glycosyltransferase family 4 protein [Candidatus Bathyarchaeota archaeon]|nr:glycosyltransferase family 4 protein [Candidatus Bathyarchaeota archaeon]
MKVAFLSCYYGLEKWGIAKYGWYLVNELRKLGVCVDVFTAKFHFKTLGPPMFYLKNAFLRLKDYDIVHSNEGAGVFLPHPCMIETYHHDYKQTYDVDSLIFHGLETLQRHKVQHIIVPSFMTKNRLLHYGFRQDKISVIYHGVDHNVFKKNESLRIFLRKKYGISNCFVVLNVGQLIKRKRQNDIVKALQGMPNTAFILVGSGKEEKNIKKLAQNVGVKLIHFKYVPESFLVDLYNTADVYIHTSLLEGFGLTVLEAISCGLPVIAYETADFSKIVGNAGFTLRQGDISKLKETIELLRRDEGMRKRLENKALKQSRKFTWKESALKHVEVYKEVLEENGINAVDSHSFHF